jgi:hypothetical protein
MRKHLLLSGLLFVFLAVLGNAVDYKDISAPVPPKIPQKYASSVKYASNYPEPTVKIKGLKAVLLGAPIDGDNGSWTKSEIKSLQTAAAMLRKCGVEVYEFYTPNNDWEKIKKAANGAHFLLYRGHGVYDGSMPPKWVGGFSLKNKFASPEDIKADLKLAQGAIVMLYGCFTAGNSSLDMGKINETEAERRIAMYSKPFLEMKCSGYYANWFGEAFPAFIAYLFAGQTLGEAYKSFWDFNSKTVSYNKHPDIPAAALWVDHDNWEGTVYNNAFVGYPDKTLENLFGDGADGFVIDEPDDDVTADKPKIDNIVKPDGKDPDVKQKMIADWSFSGGAGKGLKLMNGAYLTQDKSQKSKSAVKLDGYNDFIDCGTISGGDFSGLTVTLWMKSFGYVSAVETLISCGQDGWALMRNPGGSKVKFVLSLNKGGKVLDFASGASVFDGNWHQVTVAYDHQDAKIYIDGKLDASVSVSGAMDFGKLPLYLGMDPGIKKSNFYGIIDEVKIYNYGLTDGEIKALYQKK